MKQIEFGQLIATLRKTQYQSNNHRWTQRILAEALNQAAETSITENMISKIERGVKLPNPAILEGLA